MGVVEAEHELLTAAGQAVLVGKASTADWLRAAAAVAASTAGGTWPGTSTKNSNVCKFSPNTYRPTSVTA